MFIPSPVTGVLADRFGRIPVIAGGGVALIAAGAMAAVSPGDEVVLMAAALVMLGLGWNFGLVGGSALLTDAVPQEQRAQTQGAADLVMGLTGVSGNLVAGPLFHAGAFGVSAWARSRSVRADLPRRAQPARGRRRDLIPADRKELANPPWA